MNMYISQKSTGTMRISMEQNFDCSVNDINNDNNNNDDNNSSQYNIITVK